jgi:hypothetical protein
MAKQPKWINVKTGTFKTLSQQCLARYSAKEVEYSLTFKLLSVG